MRSRVPAGETVLDLFHRRVDDGPDRVAVVFGRQRWTYGELDGMANALASRLAERGVRRGDLVPLLVGNHPALPLAMIALLKCAAAFVPVDETWPEARVSGVLGDLDARVVPCSPGHLGLAGDRALVVEPGRLDAATPRVEPAASGPDDLAYGFYTSGTTGSPKCALNAHRGLVNRFRVMSSRFATEGTVVLQNSRHVFDSSLWQLLWPLTMGNTVVIPVRQGILDLGGTVGEIAEHAVTMTDFVPSVFNTLVAMLESDPGLRTQLRSLRRVLVGGEEASARAIRSFLDLMPDVRVTNTYGPTECAIGSVFHELDGTAPVPLGRAIDNTTVLVLDDALRPVPAGQRGEIYIGGECVGLGYRRDPERTAAVFVPNPFPGVPGPTLYRTGDRGWTDHDGLLHFAGRIDHQVKVGGVRIELAEVENALAAHPGVREAKVVVVGESTSRRLVAFVIPAGPVSAGELRDHAAAILPPTSVPRDVVELTEFPLNGNGKVDRAALAAMRVDQEAPHHAENGTEQSIQDIWTEVLGLPGVDVTKSFFLAGGDSLSAHRLIAALRPLAGRTLGIRDIVAAPTIRAQAALVGGLADTEGAGMVDLARLLTESALPVTARATATAEPWRFTDVLLTGATGFVGIHLLDELRRTPARIECLVRAADAEEARARLRATLDRYDLDPSLDRVRVYPGDLTAPGLGLDPEDHRRLAHSVDTVVHCGAEVNLMLDYDALRRPNVAGTAEILAFTAAGRPKHLHHVSSLGIFSASAMGGELIDEDVAPLEADIPGTGYAQTKWVAERMVLAARSHGVPSNVYRLGEVGPHSGTGRLSRIGLVDTLLDAAAEYGVYPRTPLSVDYTPVDHVAAVVVAAIARGCPGGTYHVVQPTSVGLDDLFAALARHLPVRGVSYETFWKALTMTEETALRLRSVLPEPTGRSTQDLRLLAEVFTDANRRFGSARTERLCAEAGIVPPERRATLRRYASACVGRLRTTAGVA